MHATYSGFADEVCIVQVAPDKDAERPFLPESATLTGCLLLADRGYPSLAYFEAVRAHGGFFIVRLTRTSNPWVCAAWVDGTRRAVATRIRMSRFLARHAGRRVDLDVEFVDGPRTVGFRIVVLPGREPRDDPALHQPGPHAVHGRCRGPALSVSLAIELCFKEWKSYANLHQFDTANPHIAEGLIWASLCAAVLKRFLAHAAQRVGAGAPISTRRVAMCARHILDAVITALRVGVGLLGALRRGSPICWPMPSVPTPRAIVALAAYAPAWPSWSWLK